MSAAQTIAAVRAAAPTANPFLAVASVLHGKFYPPMPQAYLTSLYALHGIFGLQTILLVASLIIRAKKNRGDLWMFRTKTTARGTLIVPHFAVAWQAFILIFLVALQPFLTMIIKHHEGVDWGFYIAGRTAVFLPAWLATWMALWSLAVAVSLPRSGSSSRTQWWTSPTLLNAHFICGMVVAIVAICVPGFLSSDHYDSAVSHYLTIKAAMISFAPRYSSMMASENDAAFAGQVEGLQKMLDETDAFKADFRIAWAWWLVLIVYAYGIFVTVAARYFTYLRKSMLKVTGVDGKNTERQALRKAWIFAALTSALVSLTGISYTGAALYVVVFIDAAVSSPVALQAETLVSLYGEGIFGLVAAGLALAQVLVNGSGESQVLSSSGAVDTRLTKGQMGRQVHVSVHTRTQVESDSAVVQLELADWAKEEKEEKRYTEL